MAGLVYLQVRLELNNYQVEEVAEKLLEEAEKKRKRRLIDQDE